MKITKAMRAISALILIYSIYLILKKSPNDVWNLNYAYTCFSFARTSILFYLYIFLLYLSLFPILFINTLTQELPDAFYSSRLLLDEYFRTILNASISQSEIDIWVMIKPAYICLMQIIISLMLISLILFLFKCDFSNAFKTTLFEGAVLFLYKLGEFLELISPIWQESCLSSESIVSFTANPTILTILIIYLSFDLAVQASYVQSVFSFKVKKNHILEKRREETRAGKEAKITLSTSMTRKFLTSDVVQYLHEIVERRISRKQRRTEEGMDSTRLRVFLENLYQMDPEAKTSLEAKTTLPSEAKTLFSILLSTLYRVFVIIILSYIIIRPYLLFSFFGAPKTIVRSLELSQPEAILVVLLPLLLTIILIGLLIPTRKEKASAGK